MGKPMSIRITPDELVAFQAVCPSAAKVTFDDHDWYGDTGIGVTFTDGSQHGAKFSAEWHHGKLKDERRAAMLNRAAHILLEWHERTRPARPDNLSHAAGVGISKGQHPPHEGT